MDKEAEGWRKKEEWPLLRNQQEEEDWRRRKMEKGWKQEREFEDEEEQWKREVAEEEEDWKRGMDDKSRGGTKKKAKLLTYTLIF